MSDAAPHQEYRNARLKEVMKRLQQRRRHRDQQPGDVDRAGPSPTNSLSALRIISAVQQGTKGDDQLCGQRRRDGCSVPLLPRALGAVVETI
jgi:hypothetical protein